MSSTSKYKIKNHEFNANLDGVILTPLEYELLADPDYVSELRLMTMALTFIRCHGIIEGEAATHKENPLVKIMPDDTLEELVNLGDFARQNPFTPLSEQAEAFLFDVVAERIARFKLRRGTGKDKSGYVYLIQSPTGFYKIGRTGDPNNRIKNFSIKLPFEVEYVCLIQTPNMADLEKLLHKSFSGKRANGEWFKLNGQDVELIKSLVVQ